MRIGAASMPWPLIAAALVAVGSGGAAVLASTEATNSAESLRRAAAQQFSESFGSAIAANMSALQGQLSGMEPSDATWSATGTTPQDAQQLAAAAGPVDFFDGGAALFTAAGRWTGVSTTAATSMPLSDERPYAPVMADVRRFGLGISDLMSTTNERQVIAFAVPTAHRPDLMIVRFITRQRFGAAGNDDVFDALATSKSSGDFFLLDRRGQAYTASAPHRRGQPMPGLSLEQREHIAGAAHFQEHRLDGEKHVLLTTPIADTSLTLAFQQQKADFYGGVRGNQQIVLAAVGVLLTFTLVLAFAGAHARHGRARAEAERLHHIARYDPLTGLYTRRHFEQEVQSGQARAARSGTRLALVYIDLDRFKHINDTYGHAAGDQVLSTVGGRLIDSIRGGDSAARLGGDEFAVLLEGVQAEDLAAIVAKVKAAIAEPIGLKNDTIVIQASVGCVVSEGNQRTFEDLLEAADLSMYADKADGRTQSTRGRGALTARIPAPR